MITYTSGSFGFSILFRLHGSAVFRALTPATISSGIFAVLYVFLELQEDEILLHPYPIGALVSILSFLLAYRANFSYARYWESMTTVHAMHSKWLDVGLELAAFHLQSERYNKPPAFGEHPELTCLVERERQRVNIQTLEELEEKLDKHNSLKKKTRLQRLAFWKKKSRDQNVQPPLPEDRDECVRSERYQSYEYSQRAATKNINATHPLKTSTAPRFRFPFQRKRPVPIRGSSATLKTQSVSRKAWNTDKPPLFLQEAAHLISLLSAVALSTLRNDMENADSPLIPFAPGAPWPHVNPDDYGADVRKDWDITTHRCYSVLRYLFGYSRTPKMRTLYNAARPFRVVGGVSDAEIELLQAARGPLAKVALVSMWLQEFMSREHLAGSTGKVAPPIISRLYQFTSDGMLGYNQARRIAYIPFPFPHAQITSLFVVVVSGVLPVLMLSELTNRLFGFVMNFFTVMCFCGLHEVARELENPFQNVPNDVPLNFFQAQFNEALVTMFAGCHPDFYWEVVEASEDDALPEVEEADGDNGDEASAAPTTEESISKATS